jgi:hypothetical protein
MNQQAKTPIHVGLFEADSYRIAKEMFGDSVLMEDVESQFGSALSNNPYFGQRVPYTRELFVFKTQAFYPRVPSFRVLYRYSPDIDPFNVELLSIELADDTPYDNSH